MAAALLLQGTSATPIEKRATDKISKRAAAAKFTVRDVEATRDATALEATDDVLTLKRAGVKAKGSSGTFHSCEDA